MSHLRDGASWISPGEMYWHRSLAVLTVSSSETQEGMPEAPAHDAGRRSSRSLASELREKQRKTARLASGACMIVHMVEGDLR